MSRPFIKSLPDVSGVALAEMPLRERESRSYAAARREQRLRKGIAIFGSTGSVGASAVEVALKHRDVFDVRVLAARRNYRLLARQARKLVPQIVAILEKDNARDLERLLSGTQARLLVGPEGLAEAAREAGIDVAFFSIVGAQGLPYIVEAIRAKKNVAIANKEPLVMAGEWICKEAQAQGVRILPVDSEHSAIWQCLEGRSKALKRVILTTSGGPFRKMPLGGFKNITPRQALRHPRWRMGPKITVDSATLMNKGLEIIEATHLFGMEESGIDVIVHPEAIVHSLVEFVDGSHLAQLAVADMKIPIQYALSFPDRLPGLARRLDLARVGKLSFESVDVRRFPSLGLAREAARRKRTHPAVLNAANEVAVELFLAGKIRFPDIVKRTERVLARHRENSACASLEEFNEADRWAREEASKP